MDARSQEGHPWRTGHPCTQAPASKRSRGAEQVAPGRAICVRLQELQKMQESSGALDFAQLAQFPHGLQAHLGGTLFPVPGCSRILQLSAYYARVALIRRNPGTCGNRER
jgi:hypothetical protein